uniref:Uncharacterized protein n=2 Tax=Vibrio TaxID=662 RepID=A0A0H3ZRK3_9VIBR|nr:hypothetical protein [Vibrio tasmaniensis]AKN38353.1 hypothetical protein [Vibrio sp. FF_371]
MLSDQWPLCFFANLARALYVILVPSVNFQSIVNASLKLTHPRN